MAEVDIMNTCTPPSADDQARCCMLGIILTLHKYVNPKVMQGLRSGQFLVCDYFLASMYTCDLEMAALVCLVRSCSSKASGLNSFWCVPIE